MSHTEIGSRRLKATIAALGAELVGLADAGGRQLLWDGDARWWAGRAPLLFPIVGRLPGDQALIDGQTFALPQHGFARTSMFTRTEASRTSCTFQLRSDPQLLQRYPRAFRLTVHYAVTDATLDITARVSNEDSRPMPFSFGFHPALRWPLTPGTPSEGHELVFENDEPGPVHRPSDGLLSAAGAPSPVQDRRLALRDEIFEGGALVFTLLRSRRVGYGPAGVPEIEIAFPDMPHLGVWSKPGAPFVCIEPWQGYAAPVGFAGELREKPGIVGLAANESRVFRMQIRLLA